MAPKSCGSLSVAGETANESDVGDSHADHQADVSSDSSIDSEAGVSSTSASDSDTDVAGKSISVCSEASSSESEEESSESTGSSGTDSAAESSDTSLSDAEGDMPPVCLEICCAPDSTISSVAELVGLDCRRLTLETGWDFRKKKCGRSGRQLALNTQAKRGWLALPCTPWSSIQNFNAKRLKIVKKIARDRKVSKKMLGVTLPILLTIVLENKGHFYFEWPTSCQGWQVSELLRFLAVLRHAGVHVYSCRVHGCMYGLRSSVTGRHLRKSWTILTSDRDMHLQLQRACPGHHAHDLIMGSQTKRSGFYPVAMAAQVVLVWRATL